MHNGQSTNASMTRSAVMPSAVKACLRHRVCSSVQLHCTRQQAAPVSFHIMAGLGTLLIEKHAA